MRLIDADALIKYMCDHCGASCNLEDECCSNVDAVENQPTVDAVPVVRCKDCKRYKDPNGCPCGGWEYAMEPEDFCSYGERTASE